LTQAGKDDSLIKREEGRKGVQEGGREGGRGEEEEVPTKGDQGLGEACFDGVEVEGEGGREGGRD